jgi:hypothetical protein
MSFRLVAYIWAAVGSGFVVLVLGVFFFILVPLVVWGAWCLR